MGRTHAALYGNVKLQRSYCWSCQRWAIVLDSTLQCCERSTESSPTTVVRMSPADARRRLPPLRERRAIYEKQGGRCLYCLLEFGSLVWKNGRVVQLKLEWDHMVPWSYSQNNGGQNFCAACHVCNASKSNKMFDSLEDAREYLDRRRARRGFSTDPPEMRDVP